MSLNLSMSSKARHRAVTRPLTLPAAKVGREAVPSLLEEIPSICTGQAAYSWPCQIIDLAGRSSSEPSYASNSSGVCGMACPWKRRYDHVPAGERPTFHEIRALGAWLYEQQKFPQEYIQALMGHADEKMTKHYQEGHDEKKIEYLEVGAELAF